MQTTNTNKNLVDGRRWAAYAFAGAASALTTQAAEAAITYVNLNAAVGVNQTAPFQIQPGNTFVLGNLAVGTAGTAAVAVGVMLGGSVAGVTATNGFPYVANLAAGSAVSGQAFLPMSQTATLAYGAGYVNSQFNDAGQAGYIGFRFDADPIDPDNALSHGWARVIMDGPNLNTFTFVDLAWGMPGESIAAGAGAPIPLPGSLGLLATGAAGLLGWRRRRRETISD